jgi:hypothetical protein
MPQSPSPTVSFTIPIKNDSQQVTGYKTVHVVIAKPRLKEDGGFEVILGPLAIVFFIAATIVFFASKIKAGGKIDRVLGKLDSASSVMDRKLERGDL